MNPSRLFLGKEVPAAQKTLLFLAFRHVADANRKAAMNR